MQYRLCTKAGVSGMNAVSRDTVIQDIESGHLYNFWFYVPEMFVWHDGIRYRYPFPCTEIRTLEDLESFEKSLRKTYLM